MRIRSTFQRVDSLSRFSLSCPALSSNPSFVLMILVISFMTNSTVPAVALPSARASQQLHGNDSQVIHPLNRQPFCQPNQRPPQRCVYYLTAQRGYFHSMNFPKPFPVPILCSWIINATAYGPSPTIMVYLNQMYLKRGVRAASFRAYRNEHVIGRTDLGEITYGGRNLAAFAVMENFLEVQLSLDSLDNANIRVRNFLLDVYGFNITYEIVPNPAQRRLRPRSNSCHVDACSYNGNCYTSSNYSEFYCQCQDGYFGAKCQYGPDCNPERGINRCENDGVCEYSTGSFARCKCGLGYTGITCEHRREIIENATECFLLTNLSCSHLCKVSFDNIPSCGCPSGYGLASDERTCYRLGPRRLMSELQLKTIVDTEKSAKLLEHYLRESVLNASAKLMTVGHIDLSLDGRLTIVMWNTDATFRKDITTTAAVPTSSELTQKSSRIDAVKQLFSLRSGRFKRSDVNNATLKSTTSEITTTILPRSQEDKWAMAVNSTISELTALAQRTGAFGRRRFEIENTSKHWEEEGLILEWVKVDRSDRLIKEGDRFTVVCKARGSDNVRNVSFSWYKDDAFIDPEQALRGMEVVSLPPDLNGWYRSHLEIQKASVYDRGEFRCVIGQAEEKSVLIDILSAPQVKLTLLTSTVSKGSPFMVSCFDKNPLIQSRRKYPSKYAWYRNGELLMNSCQESFEDVYPIGSLLRVAAVNESTNYTCEVTNQVQKEAKTVEVNVAPPSSHRYRYCPSEMAANVTWRSTAPNLYDEQHCPWGYQGTAKRFCREHKCSSKPGSVEGEGCVMGVWGQPDFSNCASEIVMDLREKADKLALGFMVMTWSELVEEMQLHVNELLKQRMVAYNAEGRNLVRLLAKVTWYLRAKEPKVNLTDASLRTADTLFRGGFIMETQTLTELMGIVGSLASVLSMNQSYETFDVKVLKAEINETHIAASIDRSRGQVQLQIPVHSTQPQQAYLIRYSSTFPLLASLQLQTDSYRLAQIEAVSHPLTAYVPDVNWQLSFDLAKGENESFAMLFNAIIPMTRAFQYLAQGKERTRRRLDLVPVCAILSNNPWHTELCQTDDVAPYSIHVACQCKSAGTLVILWFSGISKHESVAVSLGALGGMILSLPSIWLWATMWYRQRLSLTWLKLQFSCSVFAALCTLANATFRTPSFNVFPVVFYMLLAGFTLCITTLIGIVALSFFSMEDTRSATSKIASLSFVACLVIMAIRMIMDQSQEASGTSFWWLADTLQITFFFLTNGLLACIMLVLFFCVKRKFRSLPEHSSLAARSKMTHTFVGLLFCIIAVEVTSVFYVSKPNALSKSLLSLACVILGLSTLMTYLHHDSCLDWSVIRWQDKQLFKLGRTPKANSHAGTCQMGEASERLLKGFQKWNRPRKASLPLLKRAGLGPEVQMAFEEEIVGGSEVMVKRSLHRSIPKTDEEESHVMLEEKFGTVREACELRDLCELANMPVDPAGNEDNQPRGRGDSGLGVTTSEDSHENQRERKKSLKSSLSGWGLKVVAALTDIRSRQNTLSSENTVGTVTEEGDSVQTVATDLESRKESVDSGVPAPPTTVLLPATSCLLPKNHQPKAYSGSRKVTPTESNGLRSRLSSSDCPSRRTLRGLPRPIIEGWTDVVTVEEFQRTQSHWEELIDEVSEGSELMKPHRGKFLLRISPEKKAILSGRVGPKSAVVRRNRRYTKLATPSVVPIKNCERCWINPESPACDLCYERHTISTYAQVESLPRDDSEYIPMNCTGNGPQDYLKMNGKVSGTMLSTTEWCQSDIHTFEPSSYRSNLSAPHSPALGCVLTHATDTSQISPRPESPEMSLDPKLKPLPRFSSLNTFVKPIASSVAGSQLWTPMKFCRSLDRRQRPRRNFKPCLRRKPWLLHQSIFAYQIHSGSPFHRHRHNVIHKSDFDCNVDSKVRPCRYSLATL